MRNVNRDFCFQRMMTAAIFLIAAFPIPGFADDAASLDEIEQRIQSVVSKVMNSCVAVTDGQGFGSGVIVSRDGLVLTAGHVMGASFGRYEVIFPDGRTATAKPLGKYLTVDAGMVKITDPGPWPYVDLAELDPVVGQWVVSLGHSGGYELGRKPPVRTGRVLRDRPDQVVTDAVLIGGDSGGPLFDLDGKLVGIHSSIGDSIAENRHIKISTFRKYWTRLKSGESWGQLPELAGPRKKPKKRARMGVVVDRTAASAVVKKVHPGTPAERAGLMPGDIVSRFDNIPIRDSDHLIELIKRKKVGSSFAVEVQRQGATFITRITLEEFQP